MKTSPKSMERKVAKLCQETKNQHKRLAGDIQTESLRTRAVINDTRNLSLRFINSKWEAFCTLFMVSCYCAKIHLKTSACLLTLASRLEAKKL